MIRGLALRGPSHFAMSTIVDLPEALLFLEEPRVSLDKLQHVFLVLTPAFVDNVKNSPDTVARSRPCHTGLWGPCHAYQQHWAKADGQSAWVDTVRPKPMRLSLPQSLWVEASC